MSSRELSLWMWTEARDSVARAERLHRHFFELASATHSPMWEPPADVLETYDGLHITVALPGVPPQDVQAVFDGDEFVITAHRRLPPETQRAVIHRMEIPYGRFERRIALPAGRYELIQHDLEHGCLAVRLRKVR